MRTSFIILVSLLLAGCASPHSRVALTPEQAKAAALQLANDQAYELYHVRPFHDGKPVQFVSGHWLWVQRQGHGRFDIQATVELAADASSHTVDVQVLDSGMLF
jgi:outer membrane biogenesis lipoprotein LolB